MSRDAPLPPAPPRLLLGAALMFWGGVSDKPLVGLVCALLVEARSWTDLRWNFGERGFVRAWVLAVLLGTLLLAAFWLKGQSAPLLFDLLVWMPVFLLPVILAQNYSTDPTMPLNTFSLIARRKMLLDRAAGRPVDPLQVHVGYPYFCLVLVASALGGAPGVLYFFGLFSLMAVGLFFASPYGRVRPVGWTVATIIVGILGGAGGLGLYTLFNVLGGMFAAPAGMQTSTDRARTAIGQLGRIKQSYRILWRIDDPEPAGPRLFREAVYNRYWMGLWSHRPMVGILLKEDFDDMESQTQGENENEFAFETDEFDRDLGRLRRMEVRGRVQTRRPTPLPLPDSTQRLSRFKAEFVEYNSLGSVRVVNPEQSVVSFEVYYAGLPLYEKDPDRSLDLQVPEGEERGISQVCDSWGLRGKSLEDVERLLRERFFSSEFAYTMHLPQHHHTGPRYQDAVTRFLLDPPEDGGKAGHCEYFATATTLLLREAGIPARYCVGFSGQEKNAATGEWLLRGRHAHAWCRAWNAKEEKWEDVDLTPPDWFAIEGSGIRWYQHVRDWWQRIREDFLLWRTTEGNQAVVNWAMGIVGFLLFAYVALRLWQSRTRRRDQRRRRGRSRSGEVVVTPLHRLAKPAAHWLDHRAAGQAFTEWIMNLGERVPGTRPVLQRAVVFHWKARFDPLGLDPAEEGEFRMLCEDLERRLKLYRKSGE